MILFFGFASITGGSGLRPNYSFFLQGTPAEIGEQRTYLVATGFVIGETHGDGLMHPALRSQEDFDKAIGLFWEYRVSGWHHYRGRILRLKLCTEDEFEEALKELPDPEEEIF